MPPPRRLDQRTCVTGYPFHGARPCPNVSDAASLNRNYFNEYLKKHLSQHVEFPGTGDFDPFARIDDVGGWFGEVYAAEQE